MTRNKFKGKEENTTDNTLIDIVSSLKKWNNLSRKQSNKPKCPPSTIAFKTPGSPPPNLETRGEKSTHCHKLISLPTLLPKQLSPFTKSFPKILCNVSSYINTHLNKERFKLFSAVAQNLSNMPTQGTG